MSQTDVLSIMGQPAKNEFGGGIVEWHYCRTGQLADEFVALFFYENKLIDSRNYTVTLSDTGGATGSCDLFVKMGNYQEPESVRAIKLRGARILN
jgi:hypothetical protein